MAMPRATKLTTLLLVLAAALTTCLHSSSASGGITAESESKKKDDCRLSDITVSQVRTGELVQGQPRYRVTVANRCMCPQFGIRVRCPGGLPSAEPVDRSKIAALAGRDRGLCLVAAGTLVFHDTPVVFTYASTTRQVFAVVSATPKCALDRGHSQSWVAGVVDHLAWWW